MNLFRIKIYKLVRRINMKKGKIKFLVLSLAICLLSGANVSASSENATLSTNNQAISAKTQNYDIVKAKKDLAEKHKDKYRQLSDKELQARRKYVQELQKDLNDKKLPQAEIDSKLVDLGVYRLEVPETDDTAYAQSTSTDVSLATPRIYFDSMTQEWEVSTSGYWKNTNWQEGLWFFGFEGETCKVGNTDGIGITYYNTSGTYNASVTSSWAYIQTAGGSQYVQTFNPSNGDGKLGVEFELQDYAINHTSSANEYCGQEFGCYIWYSSGWSTFNGYARTLYAHTYKSCTIQGVSFGVSGKQFGCDIQLSSTTEGFKCYNTADARF